MRKLKLPILRRSLTSQKKSFPTEKDIRPFIHVRKAPPQLLQPVSISQTNYLIKFALRAQLSSPCFSMWDWELSAPSAKKISKTTRCTPNLSE